MSGELILNTSCLMVCALVAWWFISGLTVKINTVFITSERRNQNIRGKKIREAGEAVPI